MQNEMQTADGPIEPFADASLAGAELIIDAVFGAGLTRDVSGLVAAVLQKAQNSGVPIVAVDMPSGVDRNTGEVQGHASRRCWHGHILSQETRPPPPPGVICAGSRNKGHWYPS